MNSIKQSRPQSKSQFLRILKKLDKQKIHHPPALVTLHLLQKQCDGVFFSSVTQAAVSVRDAAGAVREVAQNILKVNICIACPRSNYYDHASACPYVCDYERHECLSFHFEITRASRRCRARILVPCFARTLCQSDTLIMLVQPIVTFSHTQGQSQSRPTQCHCQSHSLSLPNYLPLSVFLVASVSPKTVLCQSHSLPMLVPSFATVMFTINGPTLLPVIMIVPIVRDRHIWD